MDTLEFVIKPVERVYRQRSNSSSQSRLYVVGGIALIAFAAIGFVVVVLSPRLDPITMQVTTTLPVILGVGAIYAGRMAARTPGEVGVGPDGIRLVYRDRTTHLGWDKIGWSKIETLSQSNRRSLTLFDTDGRTIIRLTDVLDGFDEMAAEIASFLAAKPDKTAVRIRNAKSRRSAAFTIVYSLGFLAVSAAVAVMTRGTIRSEKLLLESGVPGQGQMERRFLAPNGVTPRIEYRVTASDGKTASRNARVTRTYWDELEGATSIPIIYVPSDPSISRLATGEEEERDMLKSPLVGYGLPAILAVMSVVFLIVSVLTLRGWDINLDQKTGRLSMKRLDVQDQ